MPSPFLKSDDPTRKLMAKKGPVLSPAGPRLLTVAAAALYLSTTVWQIRTLGWERRLPTVKLGNRFLFDVRDLDAFVESQKSPAATR
jgi:excisionase family DNA binding protein